MNEQSKQSGLLSIRVIVEGLAVAGILWLASSVQQQNIQIARLQEQIATVQLTIADVPALTREVAQIQVTQSEHDSRLDRLENGGAKVKGWQR